MGYLQDLYEGDRDILYPEARRIANEEIEKARASGLWVVVCTGPYYGRQTDAYCGEITKFHGAYGSERLARAISDRMNARLHDPEYGPDPEAGEYDFSTVPPVWPKRAAITKMDPDHPAATFSYMPALPTDEPRPVPDLDTEIPF